MRSILQKECECYMCFTTYNLELHHCIFGSGRRSKADEDGLTVFLCRNCHRALHDRGTGKKQLQQLAQKKWMKHYEMGVKDFIARYGMNYLNYP